VEAKVSDFYDENGKISTVDNAKQALELAVEDVAGDLGVDELGDDMYWDLAVAMSWDCTDEVAAEFLRTELGAIPSEIEENRPKVAQLMRRALGE
jgi:hypothetical protein